MYPTIRYNCIFTKIIFPLPSKEKFSQKPCYFGCFAYFVVSRGPLEGPLGFFCMYVSIVNILLLNISQKRPIPRFFINPLRKYKKTSEATNQTIFLIFAIFAHLTFCLKHAGPRVKMSKISIKIVSFIPKYINFDKKMVSKRQFQPRQSSPYPMCMRLCANLCFAKLLWHNTLFFSVRT